MAGTYATDVHRTIDADAAAPLIRWSAIFAGLVLGFGLLLALSALWVALAYASEMDTIRQNLSWWIGGSAVFALFVAAILTGYLSGVRSAGTGFLHGATLWAMLLVLTLTIGIPSILNVFNLGRVLTEATNTLTSQAGSTLWVSFWTIVGGFLGAGIGGAIGGMFSRGAKVDDRTVVVPKMIDDDVESRETHVVREG
jgi:hypothetical protein